MARAQHESDDKDDPREGRNFARPSDFGVERSRPDLRLNLENQANEVAKLRDVIRMLADRLEPIMLPLDSKDPGIGQDSPAQSPIAHTIDMTTDQIHFATRELEVILDRIQLG